MLEIFPSPDREIMLNGVASCLDLRWAKENGRFFYFPRANVVRAQPQCEPNVACDCEPSRACSHCQIARDNLGAYTSTGRYSTNQEPTARRPRWQDPRIWCHTTGRHRTPDRHRSAWQRSAGQALLIWMKRLFIQCHQPSHAARVTIRARTPRSVSHRTLAK